ncbi:unnamed protein product [Pedinophyceae sp. YPF-701]|nr:unnamed protein product [Pedinophyceae sp. YPF-701]
MTQPDPVAMSSDAGNTAGSGQKLGPKEGVRERRRSEDAVAEIEIEISDPDDDDDDDAQRDAAGRESGSDAGGGEGSGGESAEDEAAEAEEEDVRAPTPPQPPLRTAAGRPARRAAQRRERTPPRRTGRAKASRLNYADPDTSDDDLGAAAEPVTSKGDTDADMSGDEDEDDDDDFSSGGQPSDASEEPPRKLTRAMRAQARSGLPGGESNSTARKRATLYVESSDDEEMASGSDGEGSGEETASGKAGRGAGGHKRARGGASADGTETPELSSEDDEDDESQNGEHISLQYLESLHACRPSKADPGTLEFYVKFVDTSFRRGAWVSQADLEAADKAARVRLFLAKRGDAQEDDGGPEDGVNPEWREVERVIAKTTHRKRAKRRADGSIGKRTTTLWLVKWRGLPYGSCTWETRKDIADSEDAIRAFLKREAAFEGPSQPPTPKDEVASIMVKMARQGEIEEQMAAEQAEEAEKAGDGAAASPAPEPFVSPQDDALPAFKNGNKLRGYQRFGVRWLLQNYAHGRSCILGDEMGLGKTLQSIAVLQFLRTRLRVTGPFLVVCQLSMLEQWQREIEAWTELYVVTLHGKGDRDVPIIAEHELKYKQSSSAVSAKVVGREAAARRNRDRVFRARFDVVLLPYEMLVRHRDLLKKMKFEAIIVDEGHQLKSAKSTRAAALRQIHAPWTLLLTGTPIQNNLEELFNILALLDPKQFKSWEDFAEKYGAADPTSEQVAALQRVLRPRLLRRLKEDVEQLPTKEEVLVWVELTPEQRAFYKMVYEKRVSDLMQATRGGRGGAGPKLNNIVMLLRKVCNHPFLEHGLEEDIRQRRNVPHPEAEKDGTLILRDGQRGAEIELLVSTSGKMALLHKLLPKLRDEGHRVLIFSQFTMVLDIIEYYLTLTGMTYERVDGNVTGARRQAAIDRYMAPDSDKFVFLLSTRAGGQGITLTAADRCIIYDSDWNPQNDLQAMARCHRIGQDRDVVIYRLLSRATYEEQLFRIASVKFGLDTAVLGTMNSSDAAKLDPAEVARMLREGVHAFTDAGEGAEDRGEAFMAADIDAILQQKTEKRQIGSRAGNHFSTATFAADVDVGNKEYWESVLPDAVRKWEEEQLLALEGPRTARQRRVVTYDEERLADARDTSDEDEPPPSAKDKSGEWALRDMEAVERLMMQFGAENVAGVAERAKLRRAEHEVAACMQVVRKLWELSRDAKPQGSGKGGSDESGNKTFRHQDVLALARANMRAAARELLARPTEPKDTPPAEKLALAEAADAVRQVVTKPDGEKLTPERIKIPKDVYVQTGGGRAEKEFWRTDAVVLCAIARHGVALTKKQRFPMTQDLMSAPEKLARFIGNEDVETWGAEFDLARTYKDDPAAALGSLQRNQNMQSKFVRGRIVPVAKMVKHMFDTVEVGPDEDRAEKVRTQLQWEFDSIEPRWRERVQKALEARAAKKAKAQTGGGANTIKAIMKRQDDMAREQWGVFSAPHGPAPKDKKWSAVCVVCRNGGTLLRCHTPACSNAVCVQCMRLNTPPDVAAGTWHCPRCSGQPMPLPARGQPPSKTSAVPANSANAAAAAQRPVHGPARAKPAQAAAKRAAPRSAATQPAGVALELQRLMRELNEMNKSLGAQWTRMQDAGATKEQLDAFTRQHKPKTEALEAKIRSLSTALQYSQAAMLQQAARQQTAQQQAAQSQPAATAAAAREVPEEDAALTLNALKVSGPSSGPPAAGTGAGRNAAPGGRGGAVEHIVTTVKGLLSAVKRKAAEETDPEVARSMRSTLAEVQKEVEAMSADVMDMERLRSCQRILQRALQLPTSRKGASGAAAAPPAQPKSAAKAATPPPASKQGPSAGTAAPAKPTTQTQPGPAKSPAPPDKGAAAPRKVDGGAAAVTGAALSSRAGAGEDEQAAQLLREMSQQKQKRPAPKQAARRPAPQNVAPQQRPQGTQRPGAATVQMMAQQMMTQQMQHMTPAQQKQMQDMLRMRLQQAQQPARPGQGPQAQQWRPVTGQQSPHQMQMFHLQLGMLHQQMMAMMQQVQQMEAMGQAVPPAARQQLLHMQQMWQAAQQQAAQAAGAAGRPAAGVASASTPAATPPVSPAGAAVRPAPRASPAAPPAASPAAPPAGATEAADEDIIVLDATTA